MIVSAQVTREMFGYSFATWRFHLRGETIRSAADVGWMRELKVRQMMRRDVPTASLDLLVPTFCQLFPLGSVKQVVALDQDGRYTGLINVSEAHEIEAQTIPIEQLLHHVDDMLLPEMNIKQAVRAFDRTAAKPAVSHLRADIGRQADDSADSEAVRPRDRALRLVGRSLDRASEISPHAAETRRDAL